MSQALAPRLGRAYARAEPVLLGSLGLLTFVAAWELATQWRWLNPIVLSSPSRVAEALQRQWTSGELGRDLQASLAELTVAFALAVAVGLAVGIAMGLQRDLEYALDPFIWFFYSAPLIAFYPLIVVWLGFGFWTVVAIAFVLTVVPITVNTLAGIRSVDPLLVRVVRSFGGSRLDLIVKVLLPASMPLVLAGLRIAVSRALIGVLLGEMFSANVGLGYRLTYYGARLRTADVLVPVLAVVVLGVLATQAISLLERRLASWRAEA